jgi:hypothetical protein
MIEDFGIERESLNYNVITSMIKQADAEIVKVLSEIDPNIVMVDLINRCRIERVVGQRHETIYLDEKPVLEIYPIEIEQEYKDDRVIVRLTQKVKRLT